MEIYGMRFRCNSVITTTVTLPAVSVVSSSANLQLWNFKATGTAMAAEIRGTSDDTWSETGIIWSIQPAFGAALDIKTLNSASTGLWYQWDIAIPRTI